MKLAAGILVVIAVFTTLVSSLDVLTESVRGTLSSFGGVRAENSPRRSRFRSVAARLGEARDRPLVVFGCLVALYPVSFFGFENIVDSLYPFVGLCGMVMTVLTAARLAAALLGSRPGKGFASKFRSALAPKQKPRELRGRA